MATRKTSASKSAKAPKAATPLAAAESKADDLLPLEGEGGGEAAVTDQAAADAPTGGDAGAAPVEAPAETNDTAENGADQADQNADSEPDAPAPVAIAGGVGRYRVVATGAEIRLANTRAADRVGAGELERI